MVYFFVVTKTHLFEGFKCCAAGFVRKNLYYILYSLGSPIGMVIRILQKNCKEIKSVELAYCEYSTEADDLVLNLNNDGVRLIFCSQVWIDNVSRKF